MCATLSAESRQKKIKSVFLKHTLSFLSCRYFGLDALQLPQARSDNPLLVQPERDTFWFISINISKAFSG